MTSLTDAERNELLARARRAGAIALGIPPTTSVPRAPSGRLAETGMSFVTWKRDGQLRGCIGSVEPIRPLWADVEANAVHALLEDPRFPAATPDEFPRVRVEISVLSPFVPVSHPLAAVEVGVHGLLVAMGRRRGILLPQVAVEWGWDVPTFLGQACRKAGLPEGAWRGGGPLAAVSTFTAEVFGEAGG
ncbi:MAG: AmmeMemoRadiSam system protein A [Acidobacteriota bacterium]